MTFASDDQRVDVYCDLHRKVSSVKALSGMNKGRVIDKPRTIVLEDVHLRVSQAAVSKVSRNRSALSSRLRTRTPHPALSRKRES